jgi:hypothetical protein
LLLASALLLLQLLLQQRLPSTPPQASTATKEEEEEEEEVWVCSPSKKPLGQLRGLPTDQWLQCAFPHLIQVPLRRAFFRRALAAAAVLAVIVVVVAMVTVAAVWAKRPCGFWARFKLTTTSPFRATKLRSLQTSLA